MRLHSAAGVDSSNSTASRASRYSNRSTGTVRSIAGTLTVTDATAGVFTWTYAAGDVADVGTFDVQFNAAFGSAPTPARTMVTPWTVGESLQ